MSSSLDDDKLLTDQTVAQHLHFFMILFGLFDFKPLVVCQLWIVKQKIENREKNFLSSSQTLSFPSKGLKSII